jgi:SAM-dependent MidA family methyltransferase
MSDPVAFSAFLDRALYAPGEGFYETGGRAGRSRGDFVTSPEVGPLFGAVLGLALDAWWDDLGRPDPFLVDEHGAGPGTLARTIVAADPECADALRWTLVERSAAQRSLHLDHLPHLGVDADPDDDPRWASVGGGPWVASAPESPDDRRRPHVVLANELLDNLPFDLLERTPDGWAEVRVGLDGGVPTERLVPAVPDDGALADVLAPDATVGARIPLQHRARAWVADRLAHLAPGGRLLVLDYGSTTAALARRPWHEWLRTYAAHGRGGHPLDALGHQDVTVEVCVDQLARAVRPPDDDSDQATFLRRWGLDELVAESRASWEAGGPALDVATLRLRSRVSEAEALTDPSGLGAFRVWTWTAPPADP